MDLPNTIGAMSKPLEKRSPLKDKPLRLPGQSADERLDDLLNNKFTGELVTLVMTGTIFFIALLM